MALPITVSLTCGGTELAQGNDYLQLTLAQDLFGAHVLTITAPFDRVESAHAPFLPKPPTGSWASPWRCKCMRWPASPPSTRSRSTSKGTLLD